MEPRARSLLPLPLAMAAILAASCAKPPSPPHPEVAAPAPVPAPSPPRLLAFEATAYAIDGTTAAGTRARKGVVASDPAVLPLGSHIRIHDAGPYSGEYLVEDTGRTIDGHEIDIYVRSRAEAVKFGRRRVRVEVLRHGSGRASSSSPTAGRR